MLQTSFRWLLVLTDTIAHLYEEDQPLLITLLEFLVAVASVLHTVFHYFSNKSLASLILTFSMRIPSIYRRE
jgi:hypothetical protein